MSLDIELKPSGTLLERAPSATPAALGTVLLAPGPELILERVLNEADALVMEVRSTRAAASCPACKVPSTRVRSRYWRSLADLSAQGVPVRIALGVRRFACEEPDCNRAIFTERLPDFAVPYARRTNRLATALTRVGLCLGGQAGARLLPFLGLAASADSLLRLVRRAAIAQAPTPRVLGVDDWARRRGHTYGTILVDLERRVPVDVLGDRTAETLADWLRAHPGVEVISRDRAGAYAEGARTGAPDAVQVADRWHLLKNIVDLLERVLHQHRAALERAASIEAAPVVDALSVAISVVMVEPEVSGPQSSETAVPDALLPAASSPDTTSPTQSSVPNTGRHGLYDQVHDLRAQGLAIRAITRRLGLSRITVRKYLRADQFPRTSRPKRIGTMSAWDTHLRTRWAQGCYDASILWRELRAQGFHGAARTVREYVAPWRVTTVATGPGAAHGASTPPTPSPPAKRPSPRQARWWLVLPELELTTAQRTFVGRLTEACPAIRAAQSLAQEFIRLLRTRDVAALGTWLQSAEECALASVRDFAVGVRRDLAAVRAALTLVWSNGQTEGQITKVKLLKRQMYGRASLPLLRQRILLGT
ncbi:MAG: ISL3 family transposase [Polyangiales bacterium]